jgi:ribosomal protein S18 acetylase RimI-like enzyme
MNAIRIRAARQTDLPALDLIEKSCFPADRRSDPRALRRGLKSPFQSVWTAVSGGGSVGAMVLYHYPKSIRIYSLAVLPDFRRGGAGRRLVQRAAAIARQSGRTAVTLEAEQSNRRLIEWYGAFGFETKRVLKNYYSPGRHAVRMRLIVSPAPNEGVMRGRS